MSSHIQSVSVFRRGVTALSSQILFPSFLGFCFPSGHDTFSIPIGHLFPIFGAELKRYLSCNSCVPTQRCTFPIFGAKLKRYLSCNSYVTYTEVHLVLLWAVTFPREELLPLKEGSLIAVSGLSAGAGAGALTAGAKTLRVVVLRTLVTVLRLPGLRL